MTTPVDISPEAVERFLWRYQIIDEACEVVRALLEEIDRLRSALTAEGKRLDWLMPRVPGSVYRAHGVTYSAGPDRAAIDAAMEKANG